MRLRRHFIKFLRIAVPLGAVVALLFLLGFLAYFDSIAQYATRQASESIPGNLAVKRFKPTLRGVQLDGIRWTIDGQPFFEAESVDLLIDHQALLRRDWLVLVEHAKLHKLAVRVVVDREGNVNLSKLLDSTGEQTVDIKDLRTVIEVVDGWVSFNDQRGAGFLYELSDWQGTLVLPDGERMLLSTEGHPARDEKATLALEGEVSLLRPRANLQVNLGALDLLPFSTYPGFGDLGLVLQGRVDSSMVVQGNASTWDEVLASFFAVGKARLHEGFLSSHKLPADLEKLEGEVALLGRQVSTQDFKGLAAEIPFSLTGRADLDSAGPLDAQIAVERFSLDKLKPLLEDPPDVRGTAEAKLEVSGTAAQPLINGTVNAYNLRYQDQVVDKATANFTFLQELIHFHQVVAHTAAGRVQGQGWVFLGDEIRVLLSMEGEGANPSALMPDLAETADFKVRLMGSLDDPLLYGQGRASGLGSWAQGVGSAEGSFILAGKDLMLLDGRASRGASQVRLGVGNFNLDSQQFDGVLSTEGFDLQDVPELSGVSGRVSGRAVVSADLSGETPRIYAQGRMTRGDLSAGGFTASSASADFAFDGFQMIVPNAQAVVEGGTVEAAGAFDLRDQALNLAARGHGVSLARAGFPGETASLAGTVSGHLDGYLGLYGYADSARGRAALSGFQRPNGSLGGVAWVDAEIPGQDGSEVEAVVVADGTLERMELEYTGQAMAPTLAAVGPLDVHGSARVDGRVLTVRPTVIAAAGDGGAPQTVPYVAYSGAAYPFFGPLLSGPLNRVVVEEVGFPASRSLTVAGQSDLASGRLNLRFDLRTANLEELARQPLGNDPDAASVNEALPFDVVSGFAAASGTVTGTLSSPEVLADYSVPWLLLSNGYENRQSLSTSGRARLNRTGLGLTAAMSQTPFDARLREPIAGLYQLASSLDGMMAARGKIGATGTFDLTFATSGFDAGFLALLSPRSYLSYLPYGRIASENLRFWGTAASPSLAGMVHLAGGGVFVAGQALPFEQASLSLSTVAGETRIEDLVVTASGLKVTGSGSRMRDGRLSGEIVAREVELSEFQRFGGPLAGLSGQMDAVIALGGRFPGQPSVEIAAFGRNLVWDPAALGGLSEKIPIEEFALGHFSPDGSGIADGLAVKAGPDGLSLLLPLEGLRFRSQAGGLSLEAEGAVRFPGGVPDLSRFKTFRDWGRFFVSPKGPDFGIAQEPFRIRMRNWSFAETARLLGQPTLAQTYQATGSGELTLAGQWWEDHAQAMATILPEYKLTLEQATFQGQSEGRISGFELAEPSLVSYQREGDAGFLGLENFRLEFFGEVDPVAEPGPAASEAAEPVFARRGSLEAEARLALTQSAHFQPNSSFNLGAVDIPLENLAFMLPNVVNLGGLLESFEVNLSGPLPQPSLTVTGLITRLAVGPLQNMSFQGTLTGERDDSGGYLLSLGDAANPAVTLSFGDNADKQHQMTAQGTANLNWRRNEPLDPTRLNLFSKGLEVSADSPIDLAAQIYDHNLQILADVIPGKDVARGDWTASLSVDGTLGHPQFEGAAHLADGQFLSERYGRFENLQIDATVERISREEATPSEVLRTQGSGLITRVMLPRFEGTLGKKPFRGGGNAEFSGISATYLNMFFSGSELPIQLPELFVGTADVDLELRGRLENGDKAVSLRPVVLGELHIPKGDFQLPLGAVGDPAEAEGIRLPLEYDITMDLGQEFYVHAFDSLVRAVGQLRLLSDAGKPQLFGTVDLTRGQIRIPFYDASFRIRQGLAHFDGPLIPRLEAVEAVADLSGYRVSARVEGRYPDTLSVNLYSDPPLPQAELSRMVVLGGLPSSVTGMNDPNQSGSSSGILSGQGVSLLSGILTNRLTEQIGKIFFLSEVSFDYIPPAQYVIKLAKALDPHDTFLLTLTRVIRDNGFNESLYGIEWRLTRTFLTRIALDQYARARFWIQSINRF